MFGREACCSLRPPLGEGRGAAPTRGGAPFRLSVGGVRGVWVRAARTVEPNSVNPSHHDAPAAAEQAGIQVGRSPHLKHIAPSLPVRSELVPTGWIQLELDHRLSNAATVCHSGRPSRPAVRYPRRKHAAWQTRLESMRLTWPSQRSCRRAMHMSIESMPSCCPNACLCRDVKMWLAVRVAGVIPTPYGGVPPEPLPCPAWGHQRTEDRGWVRGALKTHTVPPSA